MKFTVNVDCTPEEARKFFGLPDMEQVNEAMMGNMKMFNPQHFSHFQELQNMIWEQMGSAMTGDNTQASNDTKAQKKA